MDLTSIELPKCRITAIRTVGDSIHVRLEPACLIQTMTGSDERTEWTQTIELVFDNANLEEGGELPFPLDCSGGDVSENIYTYRDMVPVPLESRGVASCCLKVRGDAGVIRIQGEGVRLNREGRPRYVRHIRDQ